MQNTNSNAVTYNAAVYVRLSKEDIDTAYARKAESDSISNQKQLIFDFLKNKPEINIVSVRVDDGYTGTNYDRPAFQLMLDDIKAGAVNCVVVKDLSRFGREYIDAGKYIDRLFPYYGVRLIAINDGIDTITKDASNEFGITVKNLFNDNYCRDISIKTRSNLNVKRKNGEFTGAFAPYGYKRSETVHNKLVVDEYPASVVQDIFKWKLSGMSQDGIAKKLNELGVLSPMEYKRSMGLNYKSGFKVKEKTLWTAVTVRRILTNELYIGTLIQGVRTTPNYKVKVVKINEKKDWCVIEENHEALVTEKTFDLVQRLLLLDTRTSPNEERVFPLAGLMECADCGSPLVKKLTTSGKKKYSYYMCSKNKQQHTCSSHRIKADDLENTVLAVLQNQIQMVIQMNDCLEMIGNLPFRKINLKKAEERLEKIEDEISKYRRLKVSLYEDMKDGLVSKEDYIDIGTQYEERIKNAEQSKNQVRKEMDKLISNTSEQQIWMQDFIEHKNLTTLSRTAAVELIEKVLIYEDKKIEVQFRHAEEFATLTESISQITENIVEKEAI